jgi:hypothetical protein
VLVESQILPLLTTDPVSHRAFEANLGRGLGRAPRGTPGPLRYGRDEGCLLAITLCAKPNVPTAPLNEAFGPIAGKNQIEHPGVLFAPAEALYQVQAIRQFERA